MITVEVSPEDAQHVLWQFGHPAGRQPGSFTQLLIQAAMKADPGNLARLAQGFPSLVGAVEATRIVGGIDFLVQVSEGRR